MDILSGGRNIGSPNIGSFFNLKETQNLVFTRNFDRYDFPRHLVFWEIPTNVWEILTNVWEILANVWEILTYVWKIPTWCQGNRY